MKPSKVAHWWCVHISKKKFFLAVGLKIMPKKDQVKKTSPRPKSTKVFLQNVRFHFSIVFNFMSKNFKKLRPQKSRLMLSPQQKTNWLVKEKSVHFVKKCIISTKMSLQVADFTNLQLSKFRPLPQLPKKRN